MNTHNLNTPVSYKKLTLSLNSIVYVAKIRANKLIILFPAHSQVQLIQMLRDYFHIEIVSKKGIIKHNSPINSVGQIENQKIVLKFPFPPIHKGDRVSLYAFRAGEREFII